MMRTPGVAEKCKENVDKSSPETTPAKKIKLEVESECATREQRVNLLDLSDDVLLLICYYLKPTDLMALSQSCTRLGEVASDHTLWVNVDFRPTPLSEFELKKYLKFFLSSTKSVSICGFKNSLPDRSINSEMLNQQPNNSCTPLHSFDEKCSTTQAPEECISLTEDFVMCLSEAAQNIKEFRAENHLIDGSQLLLEHFPPTLKHLSLRNSVVFGVPRCKSYFTGFDKYLPNVERLDLTSCRWFTTHSLLALSKSKSLKELILYGCPQIHDCVPYVSLGFRFGFTALTVLDLRKTKICDRELGCFNCNITLSEIYLDAPTGEEERVTDMGITMFGNLTDLVRRANMSHMVVLYMVVGHLDHRSEARSPIRKLVARNYNLVTDTSLKHAAVCLTNLVYIDVTGTGCTEEGVAAFRTNRPNVTIISNFDPVSSS